MFEWLSPVLCGFRVGDLCSKGDDFCSFLFSDCTIKDVNFAEMKRSSLSEYDCLEKAVQKEETFSSEGEETRCLITLRGLTI